MFLQILFMLSTTLTLGSAIGMVVTKNIIHSCVYLLGTLLGVAGLYVTLGADFIAAAQLMVYVGGVVILMLFAVMLTGGKEFMEIAKTGIPHIPFMGNKYSYGLGMFAAIVFFLSVYRLMFATVETFGVNKNIPPFESTVEKLGTLLVTDHLLAFEFSSVLLLGALIGAAILARPRKDL